MNGPRCHRYDVFGSKGHIEVRDAFLPAKGKKTNVLCYGKGGQQLIKHGGVNTYALQLDACSKSIQDGLVHEPMENGLNNSRALELLMGERWKP
jgi:hypothetical protein